jgi:hypothetical protein
MSGGPFFLWLVGVPILDVWRMEADSIRDFASVQNGNW